VKCLVALPINGSHVLLLKLAVHHVHFAVGLHSCARDCQNKRWEHWVVTDECWEIKIPPALSFGSLNGPRLDFIGQNVREIKKAIRTLAHMPRIRSQ